MSLNDGRDRAAQEVCLTPPRPPLPPPLSSLAARSKSLSTVTVLPVADCGGILRAARIHRGAMCCLADDALVQAMIELETAKILRENLSECYKREGVNHYEACKEYAEACVPPCRTALRLHCGSSLCGVRRYLGAIHAMRFRKGGI